jgi:hypothetical protein
MFSEFRAVQPGLIRRSAVSNTNGEYKCDLRAINMKDHVEHLLKIGSRPEASLRGCANIRLACSNAELSGFGYDIVVVSRGRCRKNSAEADGRG